MSSPVHAAGRPAWGQAVPVRARALVGGLLTLVVVAGLAYALWPRSPWWAVGGRMACGHAGEYRVAGQVHFLGGCNGNLPGDPPPKVGLAVGQELDIHLATSASGQPEFPLPQSTHLEIVRLVEAPDAGTETFLAVAPGVSLLAVDDVSCYDNTASRQFNGICPVLEVDVSVGN